MSRLIAVFLVLSMAIFPVAMARAAAFGGHSHHGMAQAGNSSHDHVTSAEGDCPSLAAAAEDGAPADAGSHNDLACCGMGACHVFQLSVVPAVVAPATSRHVLRAPGAEQVTGAFSGRLDRPPRTI
jgi:hypothetical protein